MYVLVYIFFKSYPDNNIKKMVIKSIYFIASNNKDLAKTCIEKFIDLLKLKNEDIISQTIICLRKLILEV